MKPLSIAICGCGIGGLALGILLRRAGHTVVAFDQFKSAMPVGSGFLLQPTGLAILEQLGLRETVEKHGRIIERFFGSDSASGRLVLDLRYDALGDSLNGLSRLSGWGFSPLAQARAAATEARQSAPATRYRPESSSIPAR